MYVTELVVADTVNTMPAKTMEAFADHGEVNGDTVTGRADQAREVFDPLAAVGIDFEDLLLRVEHEGVDKFKGSWTELVETVVRPGDEDEGAWLTPHLTVPRGQPGLKDGGRVRWPGAAEAPGRPCAGRRA